jgi:RNA polymerase sigma factor (sigma-70 family)
LGGGDGKQPRRRRHYRPTVEGLEALRLLSSATQAHPLSGVAAHHDLAADSGWPAGPISNDAPTVSSATWDAALVETELSQILNPTGASPTIAPAATAGLTATSQSVTSTSDLEAMTSGLSQLNKYLNRAWYRAGIPAQLHDDSSQAVYTTLIQNLGRPQFESLLADVGNTSVRDVLSRETSDGVDFFRAVDMVKKRAQRERMYQSIESVDVPSASRDQSLMAARRDALREAIAQNLSPREAALIEDTLMGKTPAEIATQWGVAPKTVSNEKTRVIQKLREALAGHELN